MMHSCCNCCYGRVEVYGTLEMICVSVFLQMSTILHKGLILTFLIQRSLILSDFIQYIRAWEVCAV